MWLMRSTLQILQVERPTICITLPPRLNESGDIEDLRIRPRGCHGIQVPGENVGTANCIIDTAPCINKGSPRRQRVKKVIALRPEGIAIMMVLKEDGSSSFGKFLRCSPNYQANRLSLGYGD